MGMFMGVWVGLRASFALGENLYGGGYREIESSKGGLGGNRTHRLHPGNLLSFFDINTLGKFRESTELPTFEPRSSLSLSMKL